MVHTHTNAATGARPRLVAGLRLVRLVGSGGEGEVWEARDEQGRQRALKLIRPDALAEDAEERSRHLLAIDHPALVRVYGGGRILEGVLGGWGFLEMDFINGPSLQDAPADPAILERLWPLAEALDLLHVGAWTDGLPLVHRDVKPANLVEDDAGELVLVDPSTLRGIDATQLTRIGTPVFSAPEVMTGRFGPPADVYSFAATVVALLTGERGERLAALLDEAHTLDLPHGVAYALSPVPGDRPVSCRAVLEAGEELADDPTVLLPALHDDELARVDFGAAPPAPSPQPSPVPPRPQRPRLSAWTLLFVLLLGVPAVALGLDLVASEQLPLLAGGVVLAHVLAHAAARRSLVAAVLCPPVAWALLLGWRVAGGARRRAWGAATFTAAMAPAVVAPLAAVGGGGLGPAGVERLALAGIAATLLLVLVVAAAANAHGAAAALFRLLLTPLWLAGAAVLVVVGLVLAPFGLARGLATQVATSLVDGVRSPAMMPTPPTPTWR